MTRQNESVRIADSIVAAPFAFPGGYRRHAVTDDGATLCAGCCHSERDQIASSFAGDGWRVVAEMIHWEGEPIVCDHCGMAYASEYGACEEVSQ